MTTTPNRRSKWIWPVISLLLAIALAVTLFSNLQEQDTFTGSNPKKANLSAIVPVGSYTIAQCLGNKDKKVEISLYDSSPTPKLIKAYELPAENAASAIAILTSGNVNFNTDNTYIIQNGIIQQNIQLTPATK